MSGGLAGGAIVSAAFCLAFHLISFNVLPHTGQQVSLNNCKLLTRRVILSHTNSTSSALCGLFMGLYISICG